MVLVQVSGCLDSLHNTMPHNQPNKATCGYESDSSSVPERNAPATREENHMTRAKSKQPPNVSWADASGEQQGEMMDILKGAVALQKQPLQKPD